MIFAWLQVAICVAASISYGFHFDWKHSVYWLAAAVLTLMVNLMGASK